MERRKQTVQSTRNKKQSQSLLPPAASSLRLHLDAEFAAFAPVTKCHLCWKANGCRRADLLKLVHPEDAPSVSAMRAHFLPEAGGEASVANGKLLGLEPFVSQEGCDGLLRGRNQVLLVDGAVVGLLAALPDDLRHTGDDEEQEESEENPLY